MDVFLYIVLPLLVAALTTYFLELSMPVEEETGSPGRSTKDKPHRKEHAASDIVDERSAVIKRETARRDERARPSQAKEEDAAPFELPPDFDIREFRPERE